MTKINRMTRRTALAGMATLPLTLRAALAAPKAGGTLTFMQNNEPQTLVALTTVATPAKWPGR